MWRLEVIFFCRKRKERVSESSVGSTPGECDLPIDDVFAAFCVYFNKHSLLETGKQDRKRRAGRNVPMLVFSVTTTARCVSRARCV